jgi:hypothetical protein
MLLLSSSAAISAFNVIGLHAAKDSLGRVILIDDEDTHRAVGQIGVFVFHGSVTLAHDGPILPPL